MFLTLRLTIFSCIRTVKSLEGIVKLAKLMCGQVRLHSAQILAQQAEGSQVVSSFSGINQS